MYTGEGKGGPDPQREFVDLTTNHSLFLISSFDIPNNTISKLPMTAPKQLKQRYYYIFWSIATLAVVCGQVYVASSYKSLAEALKLTLL